MERRTWVILELTPNGEREARLGGLSRILVERGGFPSRDVYVPIIKIGMGEPILLMEGYVFIRSGYPIDKYLSLRDTKYIKGLISRYDVRSGLISSGTMSDSELKGMIAKADLLGGKHKIGDRVLVKSGPFEGMKGCIVDVINGKGISKLDEFIESDGKISVDSLSKYIVLIEMRSVEILISYDCFSIEGE